MEVSGASKPSRLGWIREFPKEKAFEIANKIKRTGQDDPRRITHSVKVGVALTLVSMLYYYRPLYEGFGAAGIWAVLTVVVVFEFTVGATLSKGLNRGLATLLAGGLGIGAEYLANVFGDEGEPIVLGLLVFLLAGAATFSRFFPNIKKKYDYGVLIFILTFTMVSISGYRVEEILRLAHQRLSTIIIGGAVCVLISIFICPVWAGEELHNLISNNLHKLGTFLEVFGDEYYKGDGDGEDSNQHDPVKVKKSVLQCYKSVLGTKPIEESLANFAWWEPRHGRFMFRHPWKQYLKIGGVIRQCAYHIDALNAFLPSDLQEPTEFQRKIKEPCMKISSESGKALKELSHAMKTMTPPSTSDDHLKNCKMAAEDLKALIEGFILVEAELWESLPALVVAHILIDIIRSIENISESVHDLSKQAKFKKKEKKSVTIDNHDHKSQQLLHRGAVNPINDSNDRDHVVITLKSLLDNEEPKECSTERAK